MAWKLQDGRVISSPEAFTDIHGTKRTKNIFTTWTKEELLAIDVMIFHDTPYDRVFYKGTDPSDEIIDNEVYRTYTITDRYTLQELKDLLIEKINEAEKSSLETTNLYFIMEEDTGISVPVSIREDRIKIRKATDDNLATINALESYNPYVELKSAGDITITAELKNEYMTYSTKLAIRRAMREMGYEEELNTLITNPIFATEWSDTTSIDFTEPLVIQALSSLTPTLDEVKTEIWSLLDDEEA